MQGPGIRSGEEQEKVPPCWGQSWTVPGLGTRSTRGGAAVVIPGQPGLETQRLLRAGTRGVARQPRVEAAGRAEPWRIRLGQSRLCPAPARPSWREKSLNNPHVAALITLFN